MVARALSTDTLAALYDLFLNLPETSDPDVSFFELVGSELSRREMAVRQ
jgi:hypothetical protein